MKRLTTNTYLINAREDEETRRDSNILRKAYDKVFDRLQEMEIAEEQGLLIKLPCKVGDTVYVINSCKQICERSCCGFSLYTDMELRIWYMWTCEESRMSNAGKLNIDVFLTREAAEEALKGSTKEGDAY
jgi:hypothetical protein